MSTVKNAGEGVESTQPSYDVGGNEISTATSDIKAVVFQKTRSK